MLPAWIVEELKRREHRERTDGERPRLPLYQPGAYETWAPPVWDETEEEETPSSRVVVIEL